MSDKSNINLLKPVKKRVSSDLFYNNEEEQKRIKYEIGESSYNRPDILINVQDDEILRKYQNISTRELENLCERLMYYDSTNSYIPPKDFNIKCEFPTKEKGNTEKHCNQTFTNNVTENITSFGQGAVDSASNFGEKQCPCCFNGGYLNTRHLPHAQPSFSGNYNFTGIDMAGIPGTSGLKQSIEPFIDKPFDFSESALDLSINNETDPPRPIFTSDVSEAIFPITPPKQSETSNLSNDNGTQSENEVSNGENSIVTIPDVTILGNNEVVDLTNVSFVTPRRPINSPEIIEILDSTLHGNLTPKVVETIDLIDSDSDDDDNVKVSNKHSEKSEHDSKSIECPICLDPLKNKKIMSTICGHIFCSKCITDAVKAKKYCPTCRKKLKSHYIHPIYLDL